MVEPIAPRLPVIAESSSAANDDCRIKNAAKQFEALLIGQMLKSMQDAEGGWLGTGEDESASSALQYAQEMFAQSLSANGGLGLANLVVTGLKPAQGPG
jgi:peptidoglycan hydrolase FlgJ